MKKIFDLAIRLRWIVLAILSLITVFCLFNIHQVTIDPGYDRFIGKSKLKQVYDNTISTFGSDTITALLIKDPKIFTPQKLRILREFVWDLEELEGVEEIQSVFTTPHIINRESELHTSPLFSEIPDDLDDIVLLLREAELNPTLNKVLIHPEGNSVLISIKFKEGETHYAEYYDRIDKMQKKRTSDFETILQIGSTSLNKFLLTNITTSLLYLLPIVILIISASIIWGSGSIHAAILPIVIAFFSTVWTSYFMMILNIPIHLLNACIPAIAYVLGSTETTHIYAKFVFFRSKGHDVKKSIMLMAEETGLAIILTALTTVFGFLAICVNDITMLKEFGIISSIALATNFIAMAFYLPIHLYTFDRGEKTEPMERDRVYGIDKKVFQKFFRLFLGNYKVYFLLICIVLTAIFFSQRIVIDNSSWGQVKESSQLKKDLKTMDENYPGVGVLFLVITPKEGTFKEVKQFNQLGVIKDKLKNVNGLEHVQSITDIINLLHKEMNELPQYSESKPGSNEQLAQYFLTFTRDNIGPYINVNFTKANIHLRHSQYTTKDLNILMNDIDNVLDKTIDKDSYHYYFVSSDALFAESGSSLIASQISSLSIIVLIIILALTFLFRDLRVALIAVPSNLIPILCFFGILGLTGKALNVGTAMVAAITIGIAVDDTIHFFVKYSKNLGRFNNPYQATLETIQQCSSPIVTTSISLSLGFIVFLTSDFVPLSDFGLLSAMVILIAMICDLIITPTIIATYKLVNIVPINSFVLSQIPIKLVAQNRVFKNFTIKELKSFLNHCEIEYLPELKKEVITPRKDAIFMLLDGKVELTGENKRKKSIGPGGSVNLGPGNSTLLHKNNTYIFKSTESCKYILIEHELIDSFKQIDNSLFHKLCDNVKELS